MTAPDSLAPGSSIRPDEVAKFDALAAEWWDTRGPMRALHAMNPCRIGWADARLRDQGIAGGTLLDIGCGAGLAAESLAGLGWRVTGVDAADAPIAAARAHAPAGLPLTYLATTAEALLAQGATFDAITALEVIEHVADPAAFLAVLARLLRPGGAVVISTLNRTAASWAGAKLGAEYLLRLLPVGTHDWRRFITPAELAGHARLAGLRLVAAGGMRPAGSGWRIGRDLSVNYIACAVRDG